jgi:transposase
VSPEQRLPKGHPLLPIRRMVNEVLEALDDKLNALYPGMGRDLISPKKLLRTQLLMALYAIYSKEQLVEQIDYNLLFRWFTGFSMDDRIWHHSTFTKNRDRVLQGEVAHKFFARVLEQAQAADRLSKDHFSVDSTRIEALASLKSCRPKDEAPHPGRWAQSYGGFSWHAGYRASQMIHMRIEECFGGLRKSRFVGRKKPDFHFILGAAAYNLIRMCNSG